MCAKANPQEALQIGQPLHQLHGHQSGKDQQVEFTYMTHKELHYPPTVDVTFTGYIEAFSTSREMTDVVAQVLLEHTIPWFGMKQIIQMNTRPDYTSRVVEPILEALHISWKLHIPYMSTVLQKG